MVSTRNMTPDQRQADLRVTNINHMALLLTLQQEMIEINKEMLRRFISLGRKIKTLRRKLEVDH